MTAINKNAANAKGAKALAKKAAVKAPVEAAAEAKLIAEAADAAVSGHAHGASISGLGAQSVVADGEGGSSGGMGSTALILGGVALAGGIAAAAAGGGNSNDTTYVPVPTPAPTPAAPTYAVSAVNPTSNAAITSVDEGSTVRFVVEVKNATQPNQSYSLSGISADDLVDPSKISGSVTIGSDGKGYVDIAIKADKVTEGAEKVKITVGSASAEITVNDASLTPPPAAQTFTLTTGVDNGSAFAGGDGDDTFKADAASKLGAFDVLDGGAGSDKVVFSDTSATAFTLSTLATITSVEGIELSHTSDAAAATDAVTLDVSGYSSVRTLSIANQAVDTTGVAAADVSVTSKSNLTSLTINGGAVAADVGAVSITDAGADGSATAASKDTLASVTLIGTGTTTLASDALTALTLNAAGAVTNTDGYTSDTRALTITYAGGTNGGVTDAGATSVVVKATGAVTNLGTVVVDAATSLTVDNTGGGAIAAGHLHAAAATSVTVIADNAITVSDLAFGSTTVATLAISGDSLVTVANPTLAATGVLTVSGSASLTSASGVTGGASVSTVGTTGTVTLGSTTATAGIDTAVAYAGGAGVDKLSIGATTKAITLGAGNDTLYMTGSAFGTGGSVDAGDGNDTLVMISANAATASSAATFETKISNFEVLSLGATSTADAIDLANLDDISTIKSAGVTANSLTITNLQATNSVTFTGAAVGTVSLGLVTTIGTSDVVNLTYEAAAGFANTGATTVAGVEKLVITTSDTSVATDVTPVITAFTAPISATAATTVTVGGNAGIDLSGNSLSLKLTSFDASGVTGYVAADGTNTAGTVKLTTGNLEGSATITGGAGDDVLNASAAATAGKTVTINGGAGHDTITGSATLAGVLDGGAGDDIITGGSAADTIKGGDGADTINGGGGLDTLTGGAGKDTFVLGAANTSTTVYATITDAAAGDKLDFTDYANATFTSTKLSLAATATFTDYLNTATSSTSADGTVSWFQFGGDTYVVQNNSNTATFFSTTDVVVKLTGLVDLSSSTLSATTAVLTIA